MPGIREGISDLQSERESNAVVDKTGKEACLLRSRAITCQTSVAAGMKANGPAKGEGIQVLSEASAQMDMIAKNDILLFSNLYRRTDVSIIDDALVMPAAATATRTD
nr:hypothetical protein Iba_chr07fCG1670 [Ipomoea batatas]